MKRSGLIAATSVGFAVLAVGCGSNTVSTAPAQKPSAPSTPTPTTSSAPAAHKAGVGDTINLSNATNGKNIAVTLVKVVDPDSTANQFETPPSGDRFESVQFKIVNSGSGSYDDDPLIEITAKDAAGQNLQQQIVTSTAAGAQMPSHVNLAPGDTALGFVTFAVPSGDKIAQAQYTLDLGAGTTGEWQIGSGQAQAPASTPSPSSTTSAAPTAPAAPAPAAPTAPAPTSASPTTSTPSAQSVVEQYFAAITAHDYALAWALGGKNLEGGDYNSFVQGFATTASDNVTIVSTSGDTVTIQLDATQTDGTHKFFAGTYTVKDGVIVSAEVH